MLIDEDLAPLTRVWCLFETHKVIIERRKFSVSTGAFLFKAWDPDESTGKFPATKNWETVRTHGLVHVHLCEPVPSSH